MTGEGLTLPIIGIYRHRIATDGAGITTLVAANGCPLRCKWCLNRQCWDEGSVKARYTPQQLLEVTAADDLYFRATGGGVTFGGGEPLLYAAFIHAFRAACPPEWSIGVETALNVPRAAVEMAADAAGEFIVDIKDTDAEIYRRYTGGSAQPALDNLRWLVQTVGAEHVTVKLPLIPEYNDEQCRTASRERLRQLGVTQIKTLTYQTNG